MNFTTTAINVLLLLAMALPGYILVKGKLIKQEAIQYFSVLLLYVNQSFLSLDSFLKIEYSKELAINIGLVFVISLIIQLVAFCALWFAFRKWFDLPSKSKSLIDSGFLGLDNLLVSDSVTGIGESIKLELACTNRGRALRVLVINSAFGNAGFFGIPLLQLLFPNEPQIIAYAAVYIVSMNLIGWTLGCYVVSGDKRHMSLRKAIINPQVITLCVALPLFFCGITIDDIQEAAAPVAKIITYLSDMTAPLCMIIIGMRFGAVPFKDLIIDYKAYFAMLFKNLIFPLFVFVVILPFKSFVATEARMPLVL